MRDWNRKLRGLLVGLALAAAGIMGTTRPAHAGGLGALVPAYFYPGTGGTDGTSDGWAEMAAAAGRIPITAIFNPASGPGPGVDPNYVSAMTNLELAGGKVVAYIYTDYGNVPLANVEGQVTTYLSQYGNLAGNPIQNLIGGFFLDGMSNDPAQVAYYQSLYSFIKGLGSSYQVIGNPGTSTDQTYLSSSPPAADTLMTYENDAAFYAGATPPSWVAGYSPDHFANVIYNQPTVAGMQADIALAVQRNVGYVYVTDEPLNPPTGYLYDRLPSYWDQEVAAIAAAAVPEPGGMTLLVVGGLSSSLLLAARRRNRARRRI